MFLNHGELDRMTDLLEIVDREFEKAMDESEYAVFTKDVTLQLFRTTLFNVGAKAAKRHMERMYETAEEGTDAN